MRLLKRLILLPVLFTLFSTTVCAYDPLRDTDYQQLPNTVYYFRNVNNISSKERISMDNAESMLPEDLKALFRQEGVKVYITKGVSYADRANKKGNFEAICYPPVINSTGTNIDSIERRVKIFVYDKQTNPTEIIHEYGHALDYLSSYLNGIYTGKPRISNTNEWADIYQENIDVLSIFDDGAKYNVKVDQHEGFAEAFRFYFEYPTKLKEKCPEVYDYVDGQINKYVDYVNEYTFSTFDFNYYYTMNPEVAKEYSFDKYELWKHYKAHKNDKNIKAACIIPED